MARRKKMAETWTYDELQLYRRIKEDALEAGRIEDEAEEMAVREVNLERRKKGKSQRAGIPNTRLEDREVE
jgi:hypothetical protein